MHATLPRLPPARRLSAALKWRLQLIHQPQSCTHAHLLSLQWWKLINFCLRLQARWFPVWKHYYFCPCGKIISIQMRRDPASEPQSQEKMCSGKLIGWMENKWWAFKSIRRVLLSWSRFVSFLGESRKMEGRVAGAETTAWQTVAYLKVHVWTACIDNSFGLLCFAILRLSLSCSLKVNMSFYHRRCLQGTLLLLTKWWKVQLFGQLTKK